MSDGRIDVHSHFLPDFYRAVATALAGNTRQLFPGSRNLAAE